MPSAKQKRIKRQKQYAQNKEAANLYMMEYREKKKDIIQLSNKEYYKSKMEILVNYEGNKNEKKKIMQTRKMLKNYRNIIRKTKTIKGNLMKKI